MPPPSISQTRTFPTRRLFDFISLQAVLVSRSFIVCNVIQYRTLRGELGPDEFIRSVKSAKSCCADAACAVEIYRHFQMLKSPSEVSPSEDWLRDAVIQAPACVTEKGGSESTVIEMIFSICRMLGLRLLVALEWLVS